MTAVRRILTFAAGLLVVPNAYLMVLLGSAAAASRQRPTAPASLPSRRRFLVLVPAHDEEPVIGPVLEALARVDYPRDAYVVVVVADNCSDRTAEVADRAGVTVWERHDPERRGKGYALNWALARAAAELDHDSVLMIDADCIASPNLLAVVAARLDAGHDAVQVDYTVASPERSLSIALRYAAFALMNTVRPMGKTHLGLSSGLLGTGMAFRREALEAVPWEAFSIVEDAEYHAMFVASGRKVVFDRTAGVCSAMPGSLAGSKDQQMRWEGGRSVTIRQTTAPLVAEAIRRRDPVRLNAGLEWLVPPQSLLAAAQVAVGAAAALVNARVAARVCAALVVSQLAFVIGGLRLVRAPAAVYRALLGAPLLMAQKLSIYLRLVVRGAPTGFVRTTRD
jgi:hypothetical protein